MYNTFNMGIGMVIAVSRKDVKKALEILPELVELGVVESGTGVVF
jgi:phosphoribosylaminoimidazole (AIR) synthetase